MNSLTDKAKNKRMSLDPSNKIPHFQFNQRNHNTQLQMRQNSRDQSQSTISNQQQYSNQDLQRIFTTISRNNDMIAVQDLYALLEDEGYNQCLYSAVQMIALVDQKRKGYVTKKDFLLFFSNRNYTDEEKQPALTSEMKAKRQWVKEIDQNWEIYNDFIDINFCNYTTSKIKEYQNNNKRY